MVLEVVFISGLIEEFIDFIRIQLIEESSFLIRDLILIDYNSFMLSS